MAADRDDEPHFAGERRTARGHERQAARQRSRRRAPTWPAGARAGSAAIHATASSTMSVDRGRDTKHAQVRQRHAQHARAGGREPSRERGEPRLVDAARVDAREDDHRSVRRAAAGRYYAGGQGPVARRHDQIAGW